MRLGRPLAMWVGWAAYGKVWGELMRASYCGLGQNGKVRSPGGRLGVVQRASQSNGSGNVDAWPAFARLQHFGLNTPVFVSLYAAASRTWRSTLKPTSCKLLTATVGCAPCPPA